jgi:hypothetical protein
MPARRRAPQGCRLSELQYSKYVSHIIIKPESRQQNVKLFLREPLMQHGVNVSADLKPALFMKVRSEAVQTGVRLGASRQVINM